MVSGARVLISGASGLIGSALSSFLTSRGYKVHHLVRSRSSEGIYWNPACGEIDSSLCEGFDAVINLSGRNVEKGRLVGRQKRLAVESRVLSTLLLSKTLAGLTLKPRVLVSASAIGFYGDRGDDVTTEETCKGTGFMSDLPRDWELATTPAAEAGVRVVRLRIAVALARNGDPLKTLRMVFRLGVGGPIGDGRAWFSWIALSDLVRVIQHVIEDDSLSGPVNAASPQPIRQQEFANTLGKVLSRPAILPVPKLALSLRFGKDLANAILWSQRVVPEKLLSSDFVFLHPDVEGALRHELSR